MICTNNNWAVYRGEQLIWSTHHWDYGVVSPPVLQFGVDHLRRAALRDYTHSTTSHAVKSVVFGGVWFINSVSKRVDANRWWGMSRGELRGRLAMPPATLGFPWDDTPPDVYGADSSRCTTACGVRYACGVRAPTQ